MGAVARYGLGEWLAPVGLVLTATVIANLLGSAILGALAGVAERRGEGGLAWSLLGIGFSGAFTTFSTFAVEAITIFDKAGPEAAAVYVSGSVFVGLWVASTARTVSLAR